MDNTVSRIQALGQSVWIDYIRRSMLTTGELGALVRKGVTGLTSNPTIFEKAISGSAECSYTRPEKHQFWKIPLYPSIKKGD